MIRLKFALILGSLLAAGPVRADPCPDQVKKLEQSGVQVRSCRVVDFGVKAISGDYQKLQTQPVAVAPTKIREDLGNGNRGDYLHVNEAPAIKNSTFFNPVLSPTGTPASEGYSLLSKFATSVQVRFSEDQALVNWLGDREGMLKFLVPDPNASSMSGRCEVWSAWSLDPSLRENLSRMNRGILCNDLIPFTRGELKELLTVLYPTPPFSQRKYLSQLYFHPYQYPSDVEDANLALAKLGELGGGTDFTPDAVYTLAEQAKAKGENLIIDIDPGREIWNQPVEWVMDVVIEDPALLPTADYASSDYSPVGVNGNAFLTRLMNTELELKSLALRGQKQTASGLCALEKTVGLECTPASASLSLQADALARIRASAVGTGLIQQTSVPRVRHKLYISYGVEGPFGQSRDVPGAVRELDYVEVGSRKVWSPASRPLSEVCAQGFSREDRNSILSRFDVAAECQKFKAGSIPDRKILTGALPPKKFETYTAKAQFGSDPDSQMKKQAYDRLIEMMKNCDVFDEAADFMDALKLALLDNDPDAGELQALGEQYKKVSRMLDQNFVKGEIDRIFEAGGPGAPGALKIRQALFGS